MVSVFGIVMATVTVELGLYVILFRVMGKTGQRNVVHDTALGLFCLWLGAGVLREAYSGQPTCHLVTMLLWFIVVCSRND